MLFCDIKHLHFISKFKCVNPIVDEFWCVPHGPVAKVDDTVSTIKVNHGQQWSNGQRSTKLYDMMMMREHGFDSRTYGKRWNPVTHPGWRLGRTMQPSCKLEMYLALGALEYATCRRELHSGRYCNVPCAYRDRPLFAIHILYILVAYRGPFHSDLGSPLPSTFHTNWGVNFPHKRFSETGPMSLNMFFKKSTILLVDILADLTVMQLICYL
jgi:hypothetical protein